MAYPKSSFFKSGKDNPMYGKTGELNPFYGKRHTKATKEKMSKSHTGMDKPWVAKRRSQEKGRNNYFYGKHYIGKNSPRFGKSCPHGKGAYYKGIWMRSGWEINIAKWLDRMGWGWRYEPKRFELRDRTYAPDFYLPEKNIYWEIKGWFHKRHQETIEQFRELYPKEHLIVITKSIYEMIMEV